jgi:hypothetical protein
VTGDLITYKQLDDVLSRLGFTRQRVEPRWLRYEHAESDTVIILVEKKPSESVRVTDAVSARRHLVEKGLVGAQELEALFAREATPQAPVAGKKR